MRWQDFSSDFLLFFESLRNSGKRAGVKRCRFAPAFPLNDWIILHLSVQISIKRLISEHFACSKIAHCFMPGILACPMDGNPGAKRAKKGRITLWAAHEKLALPTSPFCMDDWHHRSGLYCPSGGISAGNAVIRCPPCGRFRTLYPDFAHPAIAFHVGQVRRGRQWGALQYRLLQNEDANAGIKRRRGKR